MSTLTSAHIKKFIHIRNHRTNYHVQLSFEWKTMVTPVNFNGEIKRPVNKNLVNSDI